MQTCEAAGAQWASSLGHNQRECVANAFKGLPSPSENLTAPYGVRQLSRISGFRPPIHREGHGYR